MERPRSADHPEPNIVLRGGPYEDTQLSYDPSRLLAIRTGDGGVHSFYRPTGEMDGHYPTLMRFAYDGTEPYRGDGFRSA